MTDNKSEILFEKFKIIDCLKKDDHAAVYLADHIFLNKKIILKILNTQNLSDGSIVKRFKREAQVLAHIDNMNIIRVLDFGTQGDLFYISFEYFVSNNMRYWIRNNSLSETQKRELLIQLFRGIAHAHSNNIIHRDIKPENIFISDNLQLKLGDFGLARVVNENFATAQFSVMGTPCYMSPEQVLGEQLSFRSDLFSAGIVIYELYTGVNPFLGKDVNETINRVIKFSDPESLEFLDRLPEDIRLLVISLMQKETAERIENAQAALDLLGAPKLPDSSASGELILQNLKDKNEKRPANKTLAFGINKNYMIFTLSILFILLFALYWFYSRFKEELSSSQKKATVDTIYIFKPELALKNIESPENGAKPEVKQSEEINNNNSKAPNTEQKANENKSAPAPAVKKIGYLSIICRPWANVYIDSVKVETTPLKNNINLTEGVHWLQLIHPNYPVYAKKIKINPSDVTEIRANLDTLFGYLDCKVSPWGDVYIDGKLFGQTPLQAPIKLIPGNYRVELKNSNFNPSEFNVKIQQNQTYVLKYIFKNLN